MGGLHSDRWPASVIDSWLWTLEHSHFRVMFALVALASSEPTTHRSPVWGEVEVPAGGVITSLDRLAERSGVSKAVVRGALARLAAGPLRDGRDPAIVVASNPRGYTLITVTSTADSVGTTRSSQHSEQHSDKSNSTAAITAVSTATNVDNPRSHQQLQGQGDHGQHSGQHSEAHATPPIAEGRSSDLISSSDPRSEDQENHTGDDSTDADSKRRKVERIPERAWKGADFLRKLILEAFPDNIVRKQPWGDDVKRGWRLTWADEIRLMHERDGRSYEDIGHTIRWLFQGQTAEPRFRIVVFGADALRTKWDQIQVSRKRQAEQAAAPKPNQPNRSAPEPKQWK